MIVSHRRTVEPAIQPVSREELACQIRVTSSDEDALLDRLIKTATSLAEAFTKRQLITATWQLTIDRFYEPIYVPRPRLISVSSISYVDVDGVSQTLASTVYRVDTDREPGRITLAHNQSWPTTRDVTGAVTITYTAGYGTLAANVPEDIRHAIIVTAAAMECHRESGMMPDAAAALLDPYVVAEYAL